MLTLFISLFLMENVKISYKWEKIKNTNIQMRNMKVADYSLNKVICEKKSFWNIHDTLYHISY